MESSTTKLGLIGSAALTPVLLAIGWFMAQQDTGCSKYFKNSKYPNLYKLLGIDENSRNRFSNPEDYKQQGELAKIAFKSNQGEKYDPEKQKKFDKIIDCAVKILSNPESKKEYDQWFDQQEKTTKSAKSDATKSDATKSDATKLDAKSDATKLDAKSDATKLDAKPDAATVESATKSDATKFVATKSGAASAVDAEQDKRNTEEREPKVNEMSTKEPAKDGPIVKDKTVEEKGEPVTSGKTQDEATEQNQSGGYTELDLPDALDSPQTELERFNPTLFLQQLIQAGGSNDLEIDETEIDLPTELPDSPQTERKEFSSLFNTFGKQAGGYTEEIDETEYSLPSSLVESEMTEQAPDFSKLIAKYNGQLQEGGDNYYSKYLKWKKAYLSLRQ